MDWMQIVPLAAEDQRQRLVAELQADTSFCTEEAHTGIHGPGRRMPGELLQSRPKTEGQGPLRTQTAERDRTLFVLRTADDFPLRQATQFRFPTNVTTPAILSSFGGGFPCCDSGWAAVV